MGPFNVSVQFAKTNFEHELNSRTGNVKGGEQLEEMKSHKQMAVYLKDQ